MRLLDIRYFAVLGFFAENNNQCFSISAESFSEEIGRLLERLWELKVFCRFVLLFAEINDQHKCTVLSKTTTFRYYLRPILCDEPLKLHMSSQCNA